MAETLSELVVRITADAAELKKALSESESDVKDTAGKIEGHGKSIREQFKEIGKAATVMGATITASMTGMIMSFVKGGSELNDLSLKTGVSVKALAGLKYAAEQNGASLGTIEMAIRRTSMVMLDAEKATSEASLSLKRMGLSLSDLRGLNPEEQFIRIAGAIAQVPDPMTRSALAVEMFGRSGTDMLPMLAEGEAGLRRMTEEGIKLSGWTGEGAKKADALGDSFSSLKTAVGGLTGVIAENLAPILTDIIKKITDIVGRVTDWVKEHPQLAKALGIATLAVGVLATVIGSLTLAITVLGTTTNLMFGGILILVGALTTAGILLWQNWDKVVHFFQDAWSNMKIAVLQSVDAIYGALEKLFALIPEWSAKIAEARQNIASKVATEEAVKNIHDVELAMKETEKAAQSMGDKGSQAFKDMTKRAQELTAEARKARQELDAAMNAQLGMPSDVAKTLENAKRFGATQEMIDEFIRGFTGTTGETTAQGWRNIRQALAGWLQGLAGAWGEAHGGGIAEYQHGGIVENTGLAYIHAGETVIPKGESMGITINFTQPVFFDREDSMNAFVDKIRQALDRQYRLRFGAGYSGG